MNDLKIKSKWNFRFDHLDKVIEAPSNQTILFNQQQLHSVATLY